ncbi:MAG: LytTR family transcriptional regulator [Colwellia sp.]|nr:LytTR family transcriptional regulator [Colwellia sp.]
MTKLAHFQQYKLRYEIAILLCFFFIHSTLLATSVIMEGQRDGNQLSFQLWEPFVWEYASAISTLLLFPLMVMLLKTLPFNWLSIKLYIFYYFIASLIFSLFHVGIMVAIKELVYFVMSVEYEFGDLWFELFYEYRKDVWSFIFFIIFIKAYAFIISRLQGEANPVAQGEDENINKSFDRLLVKKLGKEFIIKIEDVEWLESAGNYVNLHIKGRIYPMRATISHLSEQIADKGFCRIHRSHAINLDCIESITPLSSGDSEVKLINGKVLNLSRRYKDNFKAQLI